MFQYSNDRHSLRGSVDWNKLDFTFNVKKKVTPYAGVWIEIGYLQTKNAHVKVTPYAGVWIEIVPRIWN